MCNFPEKIQTTNAKGNHKSFDMYLGVEILVASSAHTPHQVQRITERLLRLRVCAIF